MNRVNDRSRDIGEFVPAPDDDMIICRCEEITKGEIRKAVHEGMFTLTEIRRYLRTGMGLCQGQTCGKLVKNIVVREKLADLLYHIYDIERLIGRISYNNLVPSDCIMLKKSLSRLL